jgi:hypothetical protein
MTTRDNAPVNDPVRPVAEDDAMDEAAMKDTTADEASTDEASTDEASTDEALRDEASTDKALRDESFRDEASTDDASVVDSAADDASPGDRESGRDVSGEPLVRQDLAVDLKARWEVIQQGFVDDPRRAVSDADSLVDEVLNRLSASFDEQQKNLESQWSDGEPSTEDLRSALQRYRDFFQRLLAV